MYTTPSIYLQCLDSGMVTSIPVTKLVQEAGNTRLLHNADFSLVPGYVCKRPGTQSVLGATANNILGLYEFKRGDTGTIYKMAAHGTVVQYWNTTTSAWVDVKTGLTASSDYNFLTIANQVMVCNYNNDSFLWTGSATSTPAGMPKCRHLSSWRLRAWASGISGDPLLLHACHPADPTVWDDTDTAHRAWKVYVNPDDGQSLTGTLPCGDMLLVGKERSLSGVYGTTRESFTIYPVDDHIGFGSHKSAKFINGAAYFVDQYGNVCRFVPGNQVERISFPVTKDYIDQISSVSGARAFVLNGDQYVVSYPTTSGSVMLAYDTVHDRWRTWSLGIGEVMAVTDDTSGEIYFAPKTAKYTVRLTPNVFTDYDGSTSSVFTVQVDTLELDCGLPKQVKEFGHVFLGFWGPCTVNIYCQRDGSDTWELLTRHQTLTGASDAYLTLQVKVQRRAYYIKFRVESTKAEDVNLLDVLVTYNPVERAG